MTESTNKHSSSPRNRDKPQHDGRDDDHARDRVADKTQKGLESQKDAAVTQPPFPGEPAGGE